MLNALRRRPARALSLGLLAASLLAAACSTAPKAKKEGGDTPPVAGAAFARDWQRDPAVVVRTTNAEIVALGDVHGGYDRLVALLLGNGLIAKDGSSVGYAWSGGDRTLVCTGDMIDKGTQSLAVLDLMMALEPQAAAAGGALIATLGNHEAEFLADPTNDKAPEFRTELLAKGVEPESIPQGEKPYGEWLMRRPIAAKVNDWFFAHGGNTDGRSVDEISADFRKAVDAGKWGAKTLVGDDSILEARLWWDDKKKDPLDDDLEAVGAKHIVFGHDPSAFDDKGHMTAAKKGRLFLIDVGMSPAIDYSPGALLFLTTANGVTTASSADPRGARTVLWSSDAAGDSAAKALIAPPAGSKKADRARP